MMAAPPRKRRNEEELENSVGVLDRELTDLPAELRWREWMGRVEAVLFASASPVPREDLARVVGISASIDLLIDDIRNELKSRPYELVQISGGWMLRTKARFAGAVKAAADLGDWSLRLSEMEMAILCAVAYHQPIDRSGLAEIFGKEISRDLLARLRHEKLLANGPRAPRAGAPHTFVTTPEFLAMFDLQSLRDLPELDVTLTEPERRILHV